MRVIPLWRKHRPDEVRDEVKAVLLLSVEGERDNLTRVELAITVIATIVYNTHASRPEGSRSEVIAPQPFGFQNLTTPTTLLP